MTNIEELSKENKIYFVYSYLFAIKGVEDTKILLIVVDEGTKVKGMEGFSPNKLEFLKV